MVTERENLHALVDELPEDDLAYARHVLDCLRKGEFPLPRVLFEAPIDDEPLTPEEEAAIAEGLDDLAADRVVSDEEIRREFGR